MTEKKIKISSNIDLNTIENKEISIQFSLDGFSFCVLDLNTDQYIYFKEFEFLDKIKTPEQLLLNIKAIFNNNNILKSNYTSIKVIHHNSLSSFVPKVLFDKNNLNQYIAFNNKTFSTDFYTYDNVINQEINSVFIPYVNINNFLIDQFGSFVYKHTSSILAGNLINYYAKNIGHTFFVNVAKHHFEIIISKDKKLFFYNTFRYVTAQDFIYYILFTLEQLKINCETIDLQFLGKITKDSNLYQITYKYVRNVCLINDKVIFNKHNSIKQKQLKENFSLYYF